MTMMAPRTSIQMDWLVGDPLKVRLTFELKEFAA